MDERSSSIARRAVTAVCLTVGFYLLALIVAGVLVCIPLAEMYYGGRIHIKLALICFGAAGAILVALIPPSDPFVPLGPLLRSSDHPRLFTEIENTAKAMNQKAPEDVFLVADVNAWVAEYSGKRVMGVGLPLLSILSASQFRAVLAHEFGHYYSGDTKLGPWIYSTRAAISRTIRRLSEKGHDFLRVPFREYGTLFLRVTQKISRMQEYRADELAAEYAGGKALVSGLKTTYAGSVGYDYFWRNELAPVLEEGYAPPFIAGFQECLRLPRVEAAIKKSIETRLNDEDEEDDTYESHPPLKKRIEAIERKYEPDREPENVPAICLLENTSSLEQQLVAQLFHSAGKSGPVRSISWEDTGRLVYLPKWKRSVAEFSKELAGLTPASIPSLIQDHERLFGNLYAKAGGNVAREDLVRQASYLIGASLAVLLSQRGWQAHTELGSNIRMEKVDEMLDPFSVLPDLVDKRISPEDWRASCERFDIASTDLSIVDEVVPSTTVSDDEAVAKSTEGKEAGKVCPECGAKVDRHAVECSECLRPLPT